MYKHAAKKANASRYQHFPNTLVTQAQSVASELKVNALDGGRPLDDKAGENVEKVEEGVGGSNPRAAVTVHPCCSKGVLRKDGSEGSGRGRRRGKKSLFLRSFEYILAQTHSVWPWICHCSGQDQTIICSKCYSAVRMIAGSTHCR